MTSQAAGTEPATPRPGELAPEVALPDESGTVHRLADQRGRWTVVYFYPRDDTPGCTIEACQFRDLDTAYAATDADVWIAELAIVDAGDAAIRIDRAHAQVDDVTIRTPGMGLWSQLGTVEVKRSLVVHGAGGIVASSTIASVGDMA